MISQPERPEPSPRPSAGPYASELAAELTAAAYPELDLSIDRDEVGWHWLRETAAEARS